METTFFFLFFIPESISLLTRAMLNLYLIRLHEISYPIYLKRLNPRSIVILSPSTRLVTNRVPQSSGLRSRLIQYKS